VHQGMLAELSDSQARMVSVRTPQTDELSSALVALSGTRIERTGPDGLRVAGLAAAEVGHLALIEGIELHGLAVEESDLERAFFALTAETDVESDRALKEAG